MKLLEEDWSGPSVTTKEVEYPDAFGQDFLNWLRRSKAWRENPEILERRVTALDRQLLDYRNDMATKLAEIERNRARTANARKARAEKRKAVEV